MQSSQISLEKLIESIVREVIAELTKRGVDVGSPPVSAPGAPVQHARPGSTLEVDMSAYRTPVLTESQLRRIGEGVSTVVVPCTTVVTPGAWAAIRSKKLMLVRKTQSHG